MENDTYTPPEPIMYNYKANFRTIDDCEGVDLDKPYDTIYICAYNVNTDGKDPFLRYLLTDQIGGDEKIEFPMVPILSTIQDMNTCVAHAYLCLVGLLMTNGYDKNMDQITFSGYYTFNGSIYLFYDITKCNIQICDIYRNNNCWMALIDEIVNHKHLCNIPIDESVVELFLANEELCFLVDKNNKKFEIPITGFVPKHENKLAFTCTFGEPARDKNSIFGPFNYFSDFFTSFSKCDVTEPFTRSANNNIDADFTAKPGLIRFAVFLGANKVIENCPNDPDDESETKQQRLSDDRVDTKLEELTMRISDHDGRWAENYDSVYLGPVELDDGTYFHCNLLAVKNYNQQIPLSYHYVDKNMLGGDAKYFRII